VYSHFSQTNV